ncbi:hypothetical protein GGI13_002536 [Coemansia sp. RSA 455]|nr:hypothetical protein GGI13_002536 [Coemansia sp. RSA 455]
MPRPTRKAAKPTAATTPTKPTAGQKRANATEEDELPVASPTGKRRLRSQTTLVTTPPQNKSSAADSGIEDDNIKESPSKRLATDVGASPGRSPKVTTPRYGRRISSGVIGGHPRRLTFGNNGRRTSGASDMVFDGLIDGFSPIKRNAPPETLDFDEEEDLPQAEDVLAGRKPSVADSPDEEEMEAAAAADESDSELFDIDSLVARTHKPKPVGSGVGAARALASSSLGDTSVVDLLGKGSAGELLPRRTRTRSQAPKPEPAATPTKPARGRARGGAARKTSKDQSSSSEEEEDAGDSWKPSKAATLARKPKKATATTAATTTVKRSTTAAAAGGKRASARAKPNDSEQAASTAAWSVDPKTAKYFDDIDGFELTEEAV